MRQLLAAILAALCPLYAFGQQILPLLPEPEVIPALTEPEAPSRWQARPAVDGSLPGAAGPAPSPEAEPQPMLFEVSYTGEAGAAQFQLDGLLAITAQGERSDNIVELTLVAGFPDAEGASQTPEHGAIAISTQPSLLGFDADDVADPQLAGQDTAGNRLIKIDKGVETLPMGGWITSSASPKTEPEAHLARIVKLTVNLNGDEVEGQVILTDEDGASYEARFKGKRIM